MRVAALVRWSRGVHVVGTRLWCDVARTHGVTFLSGADVPIAGKARSSAQRIVTSERTQRLMGSAVGDVLPASFARPFALGRARLELLPAGRLPGSAQLRVEIEGRVVTYAGAVNPTGGRLAEPAQVRGCDVLVVAAPLLSAPPRADAERQLVDAVRELQRAGVLPVVSAPSLALAAEATALLDSEGIPLRAPARLLAWLKRYARLGLLVPPKLPRISSLMSGAEGAAGAAVVWPGVLPPLGPACRELRMRGDFGSDLPSLLEFAVATGAAEVQVTSGWSEELAQAFSRRGLRALPLGPPEQIRLFR